TTRRRWPARRARSASTSPSTPSPCYWRSRAGCTPRSARRTTSCASRFACTSASGTSRPGGALGGRAVGFGMRVLGVDIEPVAPEPGVEAIWPADRLADLLAASDVVVFGLPLTKATHHLFTRERFLQMKRTAVLINVTRGEIIRGGDVLAALDEGLIWAVGLDVTDPEPLPKGHPLWTHPRAVITPHTAGGSPRRAGRVIDTFCENLRRMRDGRPLLALIDKQKGYIPA